VARLTNLPRPVLLGAGLFLLLLGVAGGHLYSIDGLQYFRVAERMVYDRSLVFDPPLVWGGEITNPITPIGFSLAQVPAVLLAAPWRSLQPAFSAAPYDSALLYADPFYTAAAWVNPLIVAMIGGLVLYVARRLGMGARLAFWVALGSVVSGPLLFYARADFAQPLATLLLLAVVASLVDVFDHRAAPGLLAASLALAILTRPVDGAIAAAIVGVLLIIPSTAWDPRREALRPVIETACGVAVGVAGTLLVDQLRRGAALDVGYQPNFVGSLGFGTLAELLSPGRGLLWYFPLAAVAPWGAWRLLRSGQGRRLLILGLPLVVYIPIYAKWQGLGGWAWGPRFLVPLVPLLALLAGLAAEGRWRRPIIGAIGALALLGALENLAPLGVDQLRFWGTYGDSIFGTPGFWRQFELGSFAPLGSWAYYDAAMGPDILWLRAAGSTGGLSVVVGGMLVLAGIGFVTVAWRRSGRTALAAAAGL
jgi:hypothetical protein